MLPTNIQLGERCLVRPSPNSKIVSAYRTVSNASARALIKVESLFPKAPFRFTDLPGELRNRIYCDALVFDCPIEINPTSPVVPGPRVVTGRSRTRQRYYRKRLAVSLLRTCRAINQEASPVLYGRNPFECNYRESWVYLEQWLMQIGDNIKYLRKIRVYWPCHGSVKALDDSTFGSRTFISLAPLLRGAPTEELSKAVVIERSDNEAFQRTCHLLARNKKLSIVRLWSWRGKVLNGFNTITFYRAVIVPAKMGSVTLSGLKAVVDGKTFVLDKEKDMPRQWAIQVERYTCFQKGSAIRDSLEVVNYYVPTTIAVPNRSRSQEA